MEEAMWGKGQGGGTQLFLLRKGGDLQEGKLRGDRKEVVDEVDLEEETVPNIQKNLSSQSSPLTQIKSLFG